MAHVLVRHRVEDPTKWQAAFDGAIEMRKSAGELSAQILHAADDPNDLVLLFEWDNLDNARNFLGSDDLKRAMEAAGVCSAPEITLLA
jgi:quinol monooxygenase YgiN